MTHRGEFSEESKVGRTGAAKNPSRTVEILQTQMDQHPARDASRRWTALQTSVWLLQANGLELQGFIDTAERDESLRIIHEV